VAAEEAAKSAQALEAAAAEEATQAVEEREAEEAEARREAKRQKKMRRGEADLEEGEEPKGRNWQLIGAILMAIAAIFVFYLWGVYYRRNRRGGRRL